MRRINMSSKEFRTGLKVSFLIVGTTIGAGFASGREIWEFFTSYGEGSNTSILLSMSLYAFCCYIIMGISRKIKAPHYVSVLEELMGKSLAKFYDVLIFLYLLSITVVMFAGSGATLAHWGIAYSIGVILISALVFVIFLRDVEGIMSLNSVLIPFLIIVLLSVCVTFLWGSYEQKPMVNSGQQAFPSGLAFAALNILPLIAILSAIGSKLKKVEMRVATFTSGLVLSLIALVFNESLLLVGDHIYYYEIPLFALLTHFPAQLIVGVSFVLWLAIYTTAVTSVLGMVSRFKDQTKMPQWALVTVLIIIVLPLTNFGFGNLIKYMYPLYGILNLLVFAMILLYPLANFKEIR